MVKIHRDNEILVSISSQNEFKIKEDTDHKGKMPSYRKRDMNILLLIGQSIDMGGKMLFSLNYFFYIASS